MSEERGLTALVGDTTEGSAIVTLVDLEAEVAALLPDAGYGGGARAEEGVENYPPPVR